MFSQFAHDSWKAWQLQSSYGSKVPYELWNIMLIYSPFGFQRPHWSICITSLAVFVVVFSNRLPKCVALQTISCMTRSCKMWRNKHHSIPLWGKNSSKMNLLACQSLGCSCCYRGSYSQSLLNILKNTSKMV